jgi:hypothetical protein
VELICVMPDSPLARMHESDTKESAVGGGVGSRPLIHHPSSSTRARVQTAIGAYRQPAGTTRFLAASRTWNHLGCLQGSAGQPCNAREATNK